MVSRSLLTLPFAQGYVIEDGKSVYNWRCFLEAEVCEQVVQTAFWSGLPQFNGRSARAWGDVCVHKGIRADNLVPGKATFQTVLSNIGNAR